MLEKERAGMRWEGNGSRGEWVFLDEWIREATSSGVV